MNEKSMSAVEGVESGEGAPSLLALVGAVRKHIWLVLGVAMLVVFGSAAFGLSRTKIYRASATIQIDPHTATPLGRGVEGLGETISNSYWSNQEYYKTQHRIIASKPIALAVVRELGLVNDPAFFVNSTKAPPDLPKEDITEDAVARALMRRLFVEPIKESRLVELSFEDADKGRATRVLEAVLRAYVGRNVDKATESTSSAVAWLSEQLENLRAELGNSEIALHEYKLDKQIASIGFDDQTNLLRSQMDQLTVERTKVQALIQESSARLAQLQTIDAEKPNAIPEMTLLGSGQLNALRQEFLLAVAARESMAATGKGDNHPDMQASLARLESAKSALNSEIENVKEGARRELEALRQQEGGLASLLARAEQEALKLNLMEIEYSRLKRTKDNNEKLYSLVLERSKEAGLTQMLKVNNIHVIDPPAASGGPVAPGLALILGGGALLGFAFGTAAAVARERMDRSIKSGDELESVLGLPSLGALPAMGREGDHASRGKPRRRRAQPQEPLELLVRDQPMSGFAEAVRALRTNLLFMSPDKPFRRILVTSPGPAEGKTTVATNLAVAMAQAGQRVVFVDCDLRRPRLGRIFSISEDSPGLSECLLQPGELERAVRSTEIGNLSVLAAGLIPPNPAELFHSETFSQLLVRLEEQFDLIVIDSPPLLVTDAAILSTRVDGVILVARASQTHRSNAQAAARAIRDVGGNVVGGVINAAQARVGSYGYSHYGRYGGYSEPKAGSEEAVHG